MVIAVVAVLAALVLPMFRPAHHFRPRINCTTNLRQIGIAFRLWAGDNQNCFPMQFYTNGLGAMQFADATNGFRYFQVMSNELNQPKILLCPNDTARNYATNFVTGFGNTNVSYFIGLDAADSRPAMFLAGDRNITNGTPMKNGMLTLTTKTPAGWTWQMHQGAGDVLLSDGSVGFNNSFLNRAVRRSSTNVIRLLMP